MIVRTRFTDLFLVNMLPALDEVIYETHDTWPELVPQIFRMPKPSKRGIEQTTQVSGIGQMNVVPEASDVTFDDPAQGFDKTYLHLQYGLGFKISKIAADDDKWSLIREMSRDLGRSAVDTRETVGAQVFNRAFNGSYNGPDGVPLCSVSHPMVKAGGVQANRPSSGMDLDPDSLQQALTDFRAFKGHSGKRKRIAPTTLLVAPANEFNTAEILKGTMRSDTADHTVNAFRHRAGLPSFQQFRVWDYLEDPDAWFVLGNPEDTELRFYQREKFNVGHEIEFNSRSIKTAGWQRFSVGWSDFLGVWGSPGA